MRTYKDEEYKQRGSFYADKGFLPVPLPTLREVVSNDIANDAAHGGILTSDSTPVLEFTNGDTDSAIRVEWAASNNDPVTFQLPLPPGLDTEEDIEIRFIAASEGSTDSPVISSDAFFGVGDTKVEDDSDAVDGTDEVEYVITIAAADVPFNARTLSVELTPGAHTTDDLYMYALWVEYTLL